MAIPAPWYEIPPVSHTLRLSAESFREGRFTATFQMEMDKVLYWVEEVSDTIPQNDLIKLVPSSGSCEGWNCENVPLASSPWDRITGGAKPDPSTLAAMILGLDFFKARNLLDAGILTSRPPDWSSFFDLIVRAEKSKIIDAQTRYRVLVKFGKENLAALGYEPSRCKSISYACTVFVEKKIPQTAKPIVRPLPKFKVVETLVKGISLTVRDPVLQFFESDEVQIIADEKNAKVLVRGFNEYVSTVEPTESGFNIDLRSIERKRVSLPRQAFQMARMIEINRVPHLEIVVDPRFLPESGAAQDKMILDYVIQGCKIRAMGFCFTPRYQVMARGQAEIKEGRHLIPVYGLPVGTKLQSSVTLTRTGSRFYDDAPVVVDFSSNTLDFL